MQALREQLQQPAVVCCIVSHCILLNQLPFRALFELHGDVQALREPLPAVISCTVSHWIVLNVLPYCAVSELHGDVQTLGKQLLRQDVVYQLRQRVLHARSGALHLPAALRCRHVLDDQLPFDVDMSWTTGGIRPLVLCK